MKGLRKSFHAEDGLYTTNRVQITEFKKPRSDSMSLIFYKASNLHILHPVDRTESIESAN